MTKLFLQSGANFTSFVFSGKNLGGENGGYLRVQKLAFWMYADTFHKTGSNWDLTIQNVNGKEEICFSHQIYFTLD